MKATVHLKELTFSSGQTLNLSPGDTLVVVGPNNAGKSRALADIVLRLTNPTQQIGVINKVQMVKRGTIEDVMELLGSIGHPSTINTSAMYSIFDQTMIANQMHASWTQPQFLLGLTRLFCVLVDTEHRLGITKPPQNVQIYKEGPKHPIHRLQRDADIERRLSILFKRAFGEDLMVHRNAGSEVPLYCGTKPEFAACDGIIPKGYNDAIERQKLVHEQGDGIRSFLGVLLYSIAGESQILLLDEPEAFLHPPQARLLGQLLMDEKREGSQLICATHSADFLHGVLQSHRSTARIIRLTRTGNVNNVQELHMAAISELWSDPLLRYSNAFDGLFHDHVVVCESDSDCLFYQAMIDAVFPQTSGAKLPDTLFLHTGGKDRLHLVLSALKPAGVSICAVIDFDVLRDANTFRRIIEALSGRWEDFFPLWRAVNNSVNQKRAELSRTDVKDRIARTLEKDKSEFVANSEVKEINMLLRRTSPWQEVKHYGLEFFTGQGRSEIDALLGACRGIGLHVVPVGELEGFDRREGDHGPGWVSKVIGKNLAGDEEFAKARKFVLQLLPGEIK